MPYTAEISRSNPTCFIFLLDQSGSMSEGFGEGAIRKADFVADVVNRTLHDLVIRCTRMEEIRNYYHISVIGYGASVGPAFSGSLSGRSHVPVGEVADLPARLENRTKKVPDGAGGLVEHQIRFPAWMDSISNGARRCAMPSARFARCWSNGSRSTVIVFRRRCCTSRTANRRMGIPPEWRSRSCP